MLIDQAIAVADVDTLLPVHEGRHLGDFREAVLLLDAIQSLVICREVCFGLMRFHQRLELQGQFGEKVACAAGVIDGLGRCGAALDE